MSRRQSVRVRALVRHAIAGTIILAEVPAALAQDGMIEEIVVTARKREEALVEVPLSITALGAEELSRARVTNLADVASATPGLAFQTFAGGGLSAPVIRGLAQTDIASVENNVGVFLNGVYLSGKSNINLELLDIERIEVIKDPKAPCTDAAPSPVRSTMSPRASEIRHAARWKAVSAPTACMRASSLSAAR